MKNPLESDSDISILKKLADESSENREKVPKIVID